MLPDKARKSNIAAGIWFLSMFALLYYIGSSDGGNIWDDGDFVGITIFAIHGLSLFTALWFYAEAKGYSGLLGLGLGFLYALGLIILLVLPDKHKTEPANVALPIDTSPQYSNYFVRLFNGDVPLVITYWVWGALVGGFVFGGIAALIEYNYATIAVQRYGTSAINAFYWFALAAAVFIWVAIWRSAGKYRGSGWGIVARVMVVVGVLSTLGAFVRGFDEETSLAEEVRMMNASLPTMVDESTRLDSVEYDSNMLMYFHTIVDSTIDDIDTAFFQDYMKGTLVDSLCSANDTRVALKDGFAYGYGYSDMNGDPIADIVIVEADCHTASPEKKRPRAR